MCLAYSTNFFYNFWRLNNCPWRLLCMYLTRILLHVHRISKRQLWGRQTQYIWSNESFNSREWRTLLISCVEVRIAGGGYIGGKKKRGRSPGGTRTRKAWNERGPRGVGCAPTEDKKKGKWDKGDRTTQEEEFWLLEFCNLCVTTKHTHAPPLHTLHATAAYIHIYKEHQQPTYNSTLGSSSASHSLAAIGRGKLVWDSY